MSVHAEQHATDRLYIYAMRTVADADHRKGPALEGNTVNRQQRNLGCSCKVPTVSPVLQVEQGTAQKYLGSTSS